jgi:hypothetical protein
MIASSSRSMRLPSADATPTTATFHDAPPTRRSWVKLSACASREPTAS